MQPHGRRGVTRDVTVPRGGSGDGGPDLSVGSPNISRLSAVESRYYSLWSCGPTARGPVVRAVVRGPGLISLLAADVSRRAGMMPQGEIDACSEMCASWRCAQLCGARKAEPEPAPLSHWVSQQTRSKSTHQGQDVGLCTLQVGDWNLRHNTRGRLLGYCGNGASCAMNLLIVTTGHQGDSRKPPPPQLKFHETAAHVLLLYPLTSVSRRFPSFPSSVVHMPVLCSHNVASLFLPHSQCADTALQVKLFM